VLSNGSPSHHRRSSHDDGIPSLPSVSPRGRRNTPRRSAGAGNRGAERPWRQRCRAPPGPGLGSGGFGQAIQPRGSVAVVAVKARAMAENAASRIAPGRAVHILAGTVAWGRNRLSGRRGCVPPYWGTLTDAIPPVLGHGTREHPPEFPHVSSWKTEMEIVVVVVPMRDGGQTKRTAPNAESGFEFEPSTP
jgi:hypothetical protein